MEYTYKKDGSQKYIIIKECNIDEKDYKIQMILNNNIEGLVDISIKNFNNQSEMWYNTTALTAASSLYSKKLMKGEDVLSFINAIKHLCDNTREFLLDIENICFSMDMIFVQREGNKYKFCYMPENQGFFQEKIRDLFDELLEYIDHNDKKAVLICYGIQQLTIGDDFTILDLVEYANKNINYIEPESIVSEKIDICYKNEKESNEKKASFFEKIKKLIMKESKYETEEFIEEKTSFIHEECDFNEDRTMLLTGDWLSGIVLRRLNGEEDFIIKPKEYPCIIGSSLKSCDAYIDNPVVSRVHVRIIEENETYYIEDLNSTNGTYVNDVKIKPHQLEKIQERDVITIANLQFVVE